MRRAAVSIISMVIAFCVIEALASIFLIHGASNNKRLYLVPWMIERAFQLTFYTVLFLWIGMYLLTSPETFSYSLMTIIFGGISLRMFNLSLIPQSFKIRFYFQYSTTTASCASTLSLFWWGMLRNTNAWLELHSHKRKIMGTAAPLMLKSNGFHLKWYQHFNNNNPFHPQHFQKLKIKIELKLYFKNL